MAKQIYDSPTKALCAEIIDSFWPGLPLGNLTSQLFANVYLNELDHWVSEHLRPLAYLRYCDDFVLAHTSRYWLEKALLRLREYLILRLRLTLHPNKVTLRPFSQGLDWLGYVIYPDHWVLRNSSRQRMWRKVGHKVSEFWQGEVSVESLVSTISSYQGMARHGWNRNDYWQLYFLEKCVC